MMPEMSGFDVCKIIRKDWSQYQLPVLMLTAKKGTEDVIYGLKCGANDYITKPFSKRYRRCNLWFKMWCK